jgi:hypothetical protein
MMPNGIVIIFINYSANFGRISAKTRKVKFQHKFDRTFRPKLVGFWLIWEKFGHSRQNKTIFRRRVRQISGRNLTVQILAEIR